jgi:hypothetical protein
VIRLLAMILHGVLCPPPSRERYRQKGWGHPEPLTTPRTTRR